MMDGGWMGALMGGIGAHQGMMKGYEEQDKERRDRQLAAETARYSPWTGMKPNSVTEASIGSRVAEGYASGSSAGKNFKNEPTTTGGGTQSFSGSSAPAQGGGDAGQGAAPSASAYSGAPQYASQNTGGAGQGQSAWGGMGGGNQEYNQTAAYQELMRRKMSGQA